MLKYSLKRIASSLITLCIIITVVFVLLRQMPIEGYFDNYEKTDEATRNAKLEQLGLNDPIHVQLWNFFRNLIVFEIEWLPEEAEPATEAAGDELQGSAEEEATDPRGFFCRALNLPFDIDVYLNLGTSARYSAGASISGIIAKKAPISIKLGVMSMALSLLMGIPLGAAMARSKGKFWDKIGTVYIVFINAVPAAVYYIFIQMYGTSALTYAIMFGILSILLSLACWFIFSHASSYMRGIGFSEKMINTVRVFFTAFIVWIPYVIYYCQFEADKAQAIQTAYEAVQNSAGLDLQNPDLVNNLMQNHEFVYHFIRVGIPFILIVCVAKLVNSATVLFDCDKFKQLKSRRWFQIAESAMVYCVPAIVVFVMLLQYNSTSIPMLFDEGIPATWILPVISMSLGSTASYAMWLRRYMVDEMNKDYVRLARAKGVSEKKIMMSHVFRNAFVPMIQYIPTSLLYTISGSIYIESLYSIPGMGGLLVDVIGRQDNPMVQAIVMLYSCIGIVGLLLGDLLMGMIDPRISFVKKEGAR